MNVISIISLACLVPYLLGSLAVYKNTKGYERFRRSYSALALGAVALLFFLIIDSGAALYQLELPLYAEQLRKLCAFILLLIPVNIVLILTNYLLKKPKPILLFIISAAVSLLGIAGVLLYAYFTQTQFTDEFSTILPFGIVILPLLLSLSSGGLLRYDRKFSKVVHWAVQGLVLVAIVWFMATAAAESWDILTSMGVAMLVRYGLISLAALLIPGIPFIFLILEDRKIN